MAWHPSLEETFVFRNNIPNRQPARIVVLVPGGGEFEDLVLDGMPFSLDEDATEQARMFVHVDEVKRAGN